MLAPCRAQAPPAAAAAAKLLDSLLLLACAVLMLVPQGVAGQMTSPLAGQGSPRLETRDVFVSCYLDRLLRGEN